MKKIAVSTDRGPKAIGPYSQAIKVPGLMFISGQTPLDPATGEVVGTEINAQTVRVLENVKGIVESQGRTMADVVKTTVFLKDMNDFAAMNKYMRVISRSLPLQDRPSRSQGCRKTPW